jgi:hypothetical protein
MKRLIFLAIFMALLLSTPFAMARGGASTRATLDRMWRQEQANQQRMDQNLDTMLKGGERVGPRMYDTSGPRPGSKAPASFRP